MLEREAELVDNSEEGWGGVVFLEMEEYLHDVHTRESLELRVVRGADV